MKNKIAPVHPGIILNKEFLGPMEISQRELAKGISVPPRRINEIVLGKRGISADTALRLGRYFDMSAGFWMNLQKHYEMDLAIDSAGGRIEREVKKRSAA